MMNRLSRLFPFLAVAIACGAVAAPTAAHAESYPFCTFSGSAFSAINFGQVYVPRDTPVGAPIGQPITVTVTYTCQPRTSGSASTNTYGYLIEITATNGQPDQNNPSYLATIIPKTPNTGIGLKITTGPREDGSGTMGSGANISPFLGEPTIKTTDIARTPYDTNVHIGSFSLTYQLVKTGSSVAAGALTAPSEMSFYVSKSGNPDDTDLGNRVPTGAISAQIAVPTCTTNNVSVTLPTVSSAALSSPNTLAGTTPFQIQLNCPTGSPNATVKVFMTLTDSSTGAANDGTSNNLGVASGTGNATGVKIRIRKSDGTDVYYGPSSPQIPTTVPSKYQFQVGAMTADAGGNVITIPLTASYVRPDSTPVTGGKVKAVATFTMSYQ